MRNISNIQDNHDFGELVKELLYTNSPNNAVIQNLGYFLLNNGKITSITQGQGWGFKYENGDILMGTLMNKLQYDKYIVQLGIDSETGDKLFPKMNNQSNI